MRYFPAFLNVEERAVIVVGGGEDALRKLRLLLKTAARISVIAPRLHEEIASEARVQWLGASFKPRLLDGAALVFAADPAINDAVAEAARQRGIPVNVVDRPDISTFIVPSIVDRDPLVVAIGTEGAAPVLASGLRGRIEAMLAPRIGALVKAAEALRHEVAEKIATPGRRRWFWQRYFFGPVRDAFLAGDEAAYRRQVETLLAATNAPAEGRVSFVNAGNGDPELLTLKAHRKLQEADVIVHDAGIAHAILDLARRDATRVSARAMDFTALSAILSREAKAGRLVVRLHGAFAAIAEEQVAVAAEGVAIEAVPGVEVKTQARILPFPAHAPFLKAAS